MSFMKSKMDEESVILFRTGVSISTVCASGRTVNFKLRMAGMKTKKREGKNNLYSVARQVFEHNHDNETKPTYEKYSLFNWQLILIVAMAKFTTAVARFRAATRYVSTSRRLVIRNKITQGLCLPLDWAAFLTSNRPL